MAMSGVELDAECKVVYDEVQSKKKHRYVTFMIDGGKIKIGKKNNSSSVHHKMALPIFYPWCYPLSNKYLRVDFGLSVKAEYASVLRNRLQ